ncbi:MAG: sulfatase-like hydrolase/transferase [Bacteroidetes bacterium]|nr:sulfatase-like hydrolase/transferase [Bacteroidota bacterium]
MPPLKVAFWILWPLFLWPGENPRHQDLEEQPPNLIILFSDDAGYADFGFQGSHDIRTPHLDRLAQAGVRFTSGYVTASVCSPSRAGMLTGRYQQRFGHELNLPGARDATIPGSIRGLPLSERTIADLLKEQNYVTGLVGKWHLGMADHFHPMNRGFDEFFGLRAGSGPFWEGLAGGIENGTSPVSPDSLTYLTDEFGIRAVDFIARHRNEPFFLFVSFTAPHAPMQAKEEFLDEELPRFETEIRAQNAAMTRSLDENVGKVIAALEQYGLRKNTIIVFANDNGGAMPSNGSLNAPLRGAKGTALEGGNRVPFVMSWEGVIPAGLTFNDPVSTLDILPTFLKAAGGKLPTDRTFDGVDLLPYLRGDISDAPHDTLFWKMQWGAAVRAGRWKLVRTPSQEHWLFDVERDVSESEDLSSLYPEKLSELRRSLNTWETTHVPPIWAIEQSWHARTAERYDQQIVDTFVRR